MVQTKIRGMENARFSVVKKMLPESDMTIMNDDSSNKRFLEFFWSTTTVLGKQVVVDDVIRRRQAKKECVFSSVANKNCTVTAAGAVVCESELLWRLEGRGVLKKIATGKRAIFRKSIVYNKVYFTLITFRAIVMINVHSYFLLIYTRRVPSLSILP